MTYTGEDSPSKMGDFVPALLVVDMQEDFCPPVSSTLSHRYTRLSIG